MGDSDPGSSNAAQSAQDPANDSHRPRGMFSRLKGALSSKPQPLRMAENVVDVPMAPTAIAPVLGMANLRRMRVEDVAIPKAEIVAVPLDIKKDDLVKVFRDSGLTRLPVYKGTLDTPIGLIHLKDFTLKHGFNGSGNRFSLRRMVRPLLFAPPSMPIGVLLQKMQSDRMHMALVIDEYGGVDGLVTIEDLIEQVIGEIEDEHDIDEGDFWIKESAGSWVVQSKAPLDEFEAVSGLTLTDGEIDEEVDTIGGLVFVLCGHVPARGEVVPHPSGVQFEIVDADPRRIKRVRVRRPKLPGE